jgi:hypothetical protein
MEDRELLELAAKAYWSDEIDDVCSIEWSEIDQTIAYTHADNQDHNGVDQTYLWNPLEDDGDAFRLAVKLGIGVRYEKNSPPELSLPRECGVAVTEDKRWFVEERRDPCAATRRAIVRAAAALAQQSTDSVDKTVDKPGEMGISS